MIRKNFFASYRFILLIIPLIALSFGQTAFSMSANDVTQFSGTWTLIRESQDCNGDSAEVTRITIEQKNKKVKLTMTPYDTPIKCMVKESELECSDTLKFEDGSALEVSEATFQLNENGELEGQAEWISFDTDGNSCEGFSDFSPVNYSGFWNTLEVLNDECFFYGYPDENTAEIIHEGNEAQIIILGRSFDCVVDNARGLQCTGEIIIPTDIATFTMTYNQSNLWFDGIDSLQGDAEWVISTADGIPYCYGTSVISATRSAE